MVLTAGQLRGSPDTKRTGAYYTPPEVVSYLARRNVANPGSDYVLDPAVGDGRFLVGFPNATGVDIDPSAIAAARELLGRDTRLIAGDFFEWAERTNHRYDAVIGNPPFIRYQSFAGRQRARALAWCAQNGVSLSGLTSSWAPFLVGAGTLLKRGGRLGFVVPAEIATAVYARPVLAWLMRSFGSVIITAFREKLFPNLSEDCWLLEARQYGQPAAGLDLNKRDSLESRSVEVVSISSKRLAQHDYRLRHFLAPASTIDLYEDLRLRPSVRRLGEFADVGIGYVTGDNDFFHLRPSEAERFGIPGELLRPTVRSSRDIGVDGVTDQLVEKWADADRPHFLLNLDGQTELPRGVADYLSTPAAARARAKYKCRTRKPWYVVPNVSTPDAFLSIMSSTTPRLVANPAGCACTNSVHAVTLKNEWTVNDLLLRWSSPLTAFSCEIEGHHLGGGMLKLEPREAREVLLVAPGELATEEEEELSFGATTMRKWRGLSVP